MKQKLVNERLGPVKGALLILGIVFFLVLANFLLMRYIAPQSFAVASILFWLLGGLLALWILNTYIIAYLYTLTEDNLVVARSYGKRERMMENIYLSRLVCFGTIEEVRARCPQVRRLRATHAGNPLPVMAVAYDTATKGRKILEFQPNEELTRRLRERLKKK